MDYKGFKSQALDFNVYSDGISVIAVTPQYALTRENNGTQYYSTSGWKGLTIATTIEKALTDTSDAWYSGAAFEALLNQYWDKNNTYPNTLWTREKTEYSAGDPTYSTPIKDTGGSAIGQWCLENDRTIINGAHIGTGTIDADSIKSNSITTTQLAADVLSAKNIKASTLSAITSNMGTLSVGKIQSQNYAPGTPILWNEIDTEGSQGSQGLAYELSVHGDYYSVVGIGECTDRNPLTIPSAYKSLPVRYIGNQAFENENCRDLVNVVIPNSIIGIGEAAFNFCASLTSVTIPDSVESIGGYAFHECSSLTTVSVPDTLQTLGDYAFDACSSLTTTTQDNIRYIGNENNPYLIALDTDSTTITQATISDRCKFIHAKAFINCHTLETISIPNSVIGIGSSAFYISGTSLRYNIKDNVKYLGNETNLYLVAMGFEDNTAATLTIADGCKFIYVSAFNSNGSLTSVTIPESVTSIGDIAFYECSGLTNINIPDSVTRIGGYAFEGCASLTSITIPNSVTSIGGFTFAFCGSLASVTIPDSVTSIGYSAFEGCGSLTKVTIPRSVVKLESNVFQGCTSLTSIYFEGSEEEWTLLSADANVPATATCYYYTDTKPVTAVDDYWCYSPTRGFQISTGGRNMIDSQYFKVSQDGKITATSGKIGGFAMNANSIASGSTTEGTGIRLTSGQTGKGKVIEAGTNFSVDASGNIISTGGTIGGLNISARKLSGRLYNTGSTSSGVELGITTANHVVSLDITPPTTTDSYIAMSAEQETKNVSVSGFNSASQVTTTTSDGVTTETTRPLNWTLDWTSEKQANNTYTYKAFKTISYTTSNIGKAFEKIDQVVITQIDGANVSSDLLTYENIYTADPNNTSYTWVAEVRATGWKGQETYIVTTSDNKYQDSIQLSRAINFSVSGDSAKITVSVGYLFTIPNQSVASPEAFTITNIYDANNNLIKTLQPATAVTATVKVATAGFWEVTSEVTSNVLPWITPTIPIFYIKQPDHGLTKQCKLSDRETSLEEWDLSTSGVHFASSWESVSPSDTGSQIKIKINYSNIPHSKPLLAKNVTYTYDITDTPTANRYALYIGAPFTSPTASAAYDSAPFKVKHDGTLQLRKEISITSSGEVLSSGLLRKTESGYFNRLTPGRLSVESSLFDGGGLQNDDYWTTYSQFGAINVRDYTSSKLTVDNFMNLALDDMPVLAETVSNASPASFVVAADTKAIHSNRSHHGQVYIQGIAKPNYEGEKSSVSLTIGKRIWYTYKPNIFNTTIVRNAYDIKLTPDEIIASEGNTATLSGTWKAAACLGTNSDANLKHEIESLSDEYTSLFDNLKPVRFKYNDGTSNRYHTGFIAQDVEQAIINSGLTTNAVAGYIKEADTVDENGTVTKEGARSIRYGEFVALNTDQIQKLKTRVVELETSKAELEADIVELKTSIAELTKLLNEKFNQA